MIRYIRAALKLILMAGLILLVYPALMLCDAIGMKKTSFKTALKMFYQRGFRTICNIKIVEEGKVASGPALLISNHVSYIDVNVIWSTANGDVCFTPKADVKDWPLIGSITKHFDVVYVDRTPGKTKDIQEELQEVLREGRTICVFAEATTSDGRNMKPFRSSLFSLAEQWQGDLPLAVQPVSLIYESVDGEPMNEKNWSRVAWYGDDSFFSHFWGFLCNAIVHVKIVYHEPIAMRQGETRKELCQRTEAIVRRAIPHVQQLEEGRDEPAAR